MIQPQKHVFRLINEQGHICWFRFSQYRMMDSHQQSLSMAVLQDCTAQIRAQENVQNESNELGLWFELSPVGMLLFDDDGTVVRSNSTLNQLIGTVPQTLSQVHPSLQELLGWFPNGPLAQLQPGSQPLKRQGWVEYGEGECALLAMVRCLEQKGARRRYMCVLEDRTTEDELDKAQSQLGALVETAHAGLAVFDADTGRFETRHALSVGGGDIDAPVRHLSSIKRELILPSTLDEFDRVQLALRKGERTEARYAIEHPDLGVRWLSTG